MRPPEEWLRTALQVKLKLRTADEQALRCVEALHAWAAADPRGLDQLLVHLLDPVRELIRYGLGPHPRGQPLDRQKWSRYVRFLEFLRQEGELPRMMIHRAAAAPEPQPEGESVPDEPTPTARWKHLPLPDEPDGHAEHDARAGRTADGLLLIGARVRGKKHKHDGTHCDDWFEFRTAGPWTAVAVADGAGSKKFSRVGARRACEAAVAHLADGLAGRDGTAADLGPIRSVLHGAMLAAYAAVEQAAQERAASEEHTRILGRPLTLTDLSATLLLLAHTVVRSGDAEHDLVLACQVGDGATAVVEEGGGLRLLGEPDSGSFSGETDFLTSRHRLKAESLDSRTHTFVGRLRTALVMTDGVADDYFPSDPGLLRLYADLVQNGVLRSAGSDGTPEVRLRQWLDTYQVRGSFDDRTLVALHREPPS